MPPQTVDPALHTFRSPELQSVVQDAIAFLNTTPLHPLPPQQAFVGVGIYALYYTGDFPLYNHIAARNRPHCTHSIYVGKAVPEGWRTARAAYNINTRALFGRLSEHTRNIRQGRGLDISDFSCRFILLQGAESDLITIVEATLIRMYQPLWNTLVDGFGNHDPGKGQYDQAPSEWDVLHPGRTWVPKLTGIPPARDRIITKIEQSKR